MISGPEPASVRAVAKEAPEIRLVRETLEGILHPSTASTLFFEAINASGGTLPTNAAEALELVRGPIYKGLVDRVGEAEAQATIAGLERMLVAIRGEVRKRPSRNDEITQNVQLSEESLPVYVLASSPELGTKLRAVVGPKLMSCLHVPDADTLAARLEMVPPGFLLVDGSEFPAIEPSELADALAKLEGHVVKAVWGADLPYGQSLLASAQAAGLQLTPFDRREGIEPLIDVIRSRRAG